MKKIVENYSFMTKLLQKIWKFNPLYNKFFQKAIAKIKEKEKIKIY